MTTDELRANLELELAWRQEEIAFFKNQLNNISIEEDKNKYRKSLVLILYSHMEGFIKISLQTYIQYINNLNLNRNDVITGLMVAGMHKEFLAYENLDRKNEYFKRELPEDKKLHRLYRRVDFMEHIDELTDNPLEIDDTLIDTESNLWYIVLQKNLYKIGLPINLFDEYSSEIDSLVNRRNSIAHGNFRAGVTNTDFELWERNVVNILSGIIRIIYDYANNNRYMKYNID